jgi:hypothetical protein
MDMLDTEHDLSAFREKAITAGINDVGKGAAGVSAISKVDEVAGRLDDCSKDRRIPKMVRSYFKDMTEAFEAVHYCLRPAAEFVLDIGDSRFYGVHVPTDQILAEIGERVGFRLSERRILANRRSRDKTPLVQVELRFVKGHL